MVNAVLAFFLFGKMNFQSRAVNWVASSTFATYLIHRNNVVIERVLKPVTLSIDSGSLSIVCETGALLLLSVAIFVICILIDKILSTPLSRAQSVLAGWLDRIDIRGFSFR